MQGETLGLMLRRAAQDLQSGSKENRFAARVLHTILATRADVAERLAVAHMRLIDQPAGGEGPSFAYLVEQREQAEAAWRAINEGKVAPHA